MAKPIEYVVELGEREAMAFIADRLEHKPNPARDAAIERARKLHIEIR